MRVAFIDEALDGGLFHEEMQCFVIEIKYEPVTRTGTVLIADGNCTSMSGAVDLFEKIDPEVRRIDTVQCGHARLRRRDTTYIRHPLLPNEAREFERRAGVWSGNRPWEAFEGVRE